MPTRQVSAGGGNVIGKFPSLKMGRLVSYESLLERDMFLLLDFDPEVTFFEEQPVAIEYERDGRTLHYIPDIHVVRAGKHELVECKPQHLVDSEENLHKWVAARLWCAEHRWRFRVVTDVDIRELQRYRLRNVRFLTQFARHNIPAEVKEWITSCLRSAGRPVTLEDLAQLVAPDDPTSAITPILHMARHHELLIPVDDEPITEWSLVTLPDTD